VAWAELGTLHRKRRGHWPASRPVGPAARRSDAECGPECLGGSLETDQEKSQDEAEPVGNQIAGPVQARDQGVEGRSMPVSGTGHAQCRFTGMVKVPSMVAPEAVWQVMANW